MKGLDPGSPQKGEVLVEVDRDERGDAEDRWSRDSHP